MQVPLLSIVCMFISALVAIAIPVSIFIYLRKRISMPAVPMLVGFLAFFVFVLVLESSVHHVVLGKFALKNTPWLYMLYGGLMAGLFEETARFLSFTLLKKKFNTIGTAFSYGIGHGGGEAVLLLGLSMIANITLSILINTGNMDLITAKIPEANMESIHTITSTLVTTKPYMFLVGGFERFFAVIVQLSLSVIVFYSVMGKNAKWLFPLAIVLHAIVDFPAALMQAGAFKSILLVESILVVVAALLVWIAFKVHKKYGGQLVENGKLKVENDYSINS